MGKKKPTRIITPRIVQPGEGGIRPWLWLLFLVALAAWSWQVFEFGRQRAGFDGSRSDQRQAALEQRIVELEVYGEEIRVAATGATPEIASADLRAALDEAGMQRFDLVVNLIIGGRQRLPGQTLEGNTN